MQSQFQSRNRFPVTPQAARTFTLALAAGMLLCATIPAGAQHDRPSEKPPTYTVLHTFTGMQDGAVPVNITDFDRDGNLYGVTLGGGNTGYANCQFYTGSGCGVIFKIGHDGRESNVYEFTPPIQYQELTPSPLIRDEAGNFYGVNETTLYKLTPGGHETDLYLFSDYQNNLYYYPNGLYPMGDIVRDHEGNLYGVTYDGGSPEGSCPVSGKFVYPMGCGAVYKVDPQGRETILYGFTGEADGGNPESGLIRDDEGNLYGVTKYWGRGDSAFNCFYGSPQGCGVIFKVDPKGNETVLYSFTGGSDGANPVGLTRDRDGNFYGATEILGVVPGDQPSFGTLFKFDTHGKFTLLYTFTGHEDGGTPIAAPTLVGNDLYGTTAAGGNDVQSIGGGTGVIYKFDLTTRKETVLYDFPQSDAGVTGTAPAPDGGAPAGKLTADAEGNLYGVTLQGGDYSGTACRQAGCGVVYKLTLHEKCDDRRDRFDNSHNCDIRHDRFRDPHGWPFDDRW